MNRLMSKRYTGTCFDQEVCWIQARNEFDMLVANLKAYQNGVMTRQVGIEELSTA